MFPLLALFLLLTVPSLGQLSIPMESQRGYIRQRVGVTDVSVDYSRPKVKDRKIFGDVVPYGRIWRAGANENTVFTVTTPVTVNGTALPAGSYGLHMIPREGMWTVIFSKQNSAWGSYFYDEKQDAARIEVRPTTGSHTELLTFDVTDVTSSQAIIEMRWSTVSVACTIAVNLNNTVIPDLTAQLTGLAGFTASNYVAAAQYVVDNDLDVSIASAWLDRALRSQPSFTAYMLSADIAERKNETKQASELRDKALKIATNAEMNAYGYSLLQQKRSSDALAIFMMNAERHASDPNVWDSLGEAYALSGNSAEAKKHFQKALSMNPPPQVRQNSEKWLKDLEANGSR
ncbi:MAG TPA: hypothetical protein DIS79_08510 [Bacteroidetes bacterium]|nr:hypothetical protein [Bacteroidota bacterium]HRK05271.1 DUF2911 domain-containing protein [Chlorobiota bacterium]